MRPGEGWTEERAFVLFGKGTEVQYGSWTAEGRHVKQEPA